MYKCFKCQKELSDKEIKKRIICPYCGSRLVVKSRPETIKKVKAR
ncbi:DNA-directed RNA polymerase subunit P [Candidatus Woesearchaeota archaeon]|nr:DNA-directed RNA polymerase subunit P [Candidatus Woesearchaeota archaeon]